MRRVPRLLLVAGLVAIVLLVSRESARDVTVAYALPAGEELSSLEVDVLQGGTALRHAEFRLGAGSSNPPSHAMRLHDGDYSLRLRLAGRDGRVRRVTLPLTVAGNGPVVLPVPAPPPGGD